MAISRLTGSRNWVELASNSPTSGSTVTFSDLARYKNYYVTGVNIDISAQTNFNITFNNDTGSNYSYLYTSSNGAVSVTAPSTAIKTGSHIDTSDITLKMQIQGADELVKQIEYSSVSGSDVTAYGDAFWDSQSVISRIDIALASGTYSGGTFKVYGRN